MAAIFRAAVNFPLPLFGTISGLKAWSRNMGRYYMVPKMVPWALTGLVGGMWVIWPALDDEWKKSFGMGPAWAPKVVALMARDDPRLDPVAMTKIGASHKKNHVKVTEEETQVMASAHGVPLTESMHATIRFDETHVEKRYPDAPSQTEAETRAQDIEHYYQLLANAGLQVPPLEFVRVEDGVVVVHTGRIFPKKTNREHYDNCFHQIANASDSKLQNEITLLAFQETLKVVRAVVDGEKPIGYDISPQNYIYDQDGKVYCVDFYPPRLGFNRESGEKLPVNKCLVDYLDSGEAQRDPARHLRLQESYYTSAGMLRQFTHFFVATRYAKEKVSVKEIMEKSQDLIQQMEEELKNDRFLLEQFRTYVKKGLEQDLIYRLPKVRQLWKQSMTPSTLIVAASGKGSRALQVLGMNKLAYPLLDGTPLVGHVVDAICEDIKIGKVLFVINDEDEEVKQAIETHAKARPYEYALVSGTPGAGVGSAFYEGMKNAPPGSVVLTIGDTVVYNAAGLFATDQPVKVGVICQETSGGQEEGSLGKTRTTTIGQDNKAWIGVYYFDEDARAQAESQFRHALAGNRPESMNAKGEYRFSWLIQALEKEQEVGVGLGDVGKVAELNFHNNVSDIENMVKLRRASHQDAKNA